MRVLVTGGLGFIGQGCVARLLEKNVEVSILDSLDPDVHGQNPDPEAYRRELDPEVELVVGNVGDPAVLTPVLERADAVIHLASLTSVPGSMQQRPRYLKENVAGTVALCDAMARGGRIERWVLASSRGVYGEGPYRCPSGCEGIPGAVRRDATQLGLGQWQPRCPRCDTEMEALPATEDSALAPVSFYGSTKVTQEELASQTRLMTGLPATILRLQNVYGPGQHREVPDVGVANIFARLVQDGTTLRLFEDGRTVRDYVYVDDVAELMVASALGRFEGRENPVLNVGEGVGTELVELARGLVELTDRDVEIVVSGDYRVGDIRSSVADTTRLQAAYDWKPVRLREGLRRLTEWTREDVRS